MISQIGKELSNVNQRIFNHRAFVNGEVDHFLHNFELNRCDIEVDTLFKVTEIIGEIKYGLSDRCSKLATENLDEINTELTSSLNNINNFLEDLNKEKAPCEWFVKSEKEREQRKIEFDNELEHQYKRVDNSFDVKEEEISEFYADLELKLNITK